MKPESRVFLEQANIMLARGDRLLAGALSEDAARCAYLACFHVAQAVIFERTSKIIKTHHGVHTEFNRLVSNIANLDNNLRKFLSQSYDFKAVADYGIGPTAIIPLSEATTAVETAKRFVKNFAALIP